MLSSIMGGPFFYMNVGQRARPCSAIQCRLVFGSKYNMHLYWTTKSLLVDSNRENKRPSGLPPPGPTHRWYPRPPWPAFQTRPVLSTNMHIDNSGKKSSNWIIKYFNLMSITEFDCNCANPHTVWSLNSTWGSAHFLNGIRTTEYR